MVGISEVSLFDCFNVVDEGYLLECVGLANTQHFQRDQTIRRQFGDACQGKITAKKNRNYQQIRYKTYLQFLQILQSNKRIDGQVNQLLVPLQTSTEGKNENEYDFYDKFVRINKDFLKNLTFFLMKLIKINKKLKKRTFFLEFFP